MQYLLIILLCFALMKLENGPDILECPIFTTELPIIKALRLPLGIEFRVVLNLNALFFIRADEVELLERKVFELVADVKKHEADYQAFENLIIELVCLELYREQAGVPVRLAFIAALHRATGIFLCEDVAVASLNDYLDGFTECYTQRVQREGFTSEVRHEPELVALLQKFNQSLMGEFMKKDVPPVDRYYEYLRALKLNT